VSFGVRPSFTPRALAREAAEHGGHQAAVWRGGVGPRVAERSEAGALAGHRREGFQKVACRSRQAIEARDHSR